MFSQFLKSRKFRVRAKERIQLRRVFSNKLESEKNCRFSGALSVL